MLKNEGCPFKVFTCLLGTLLQERVNTLAALCVAWTDLLRPLLSLRFGHLCNVCGSILLVGVKKLLHFGILLRFDFDITVSGTSLKSPKSREEKGQGAAERWPCAEMNPAI
jgi:hypothetical protein